MLLIASNRAEHYALQKVIGVRKSVLELQRKKERNFEIETFFTAFDINLFQIILL